jgi:two-component system, NarL family, nitrate/nitrite response regulator NarL
LSIKGAEHMDQEVISETQIHPLAHAPFDHVTTFLICRNVLLRTGISHALADTPFVVAEAFDDLFAFPAIVGETPALILLCESLSPHVYEEALEKLKAQCPFARVVILADHLEPQAVKRLCAAGLDGLFPTAMPQPALLKALELVMLGETFLPASVSFELLKQGSRPQLWDGQAAPAPNTPEGIGKLSKREAQILHCLTQGASNKLIARDLGVAEATVKVHIKAILRKVKVANRTQAAMWAQQHLELATSNQS